ncbi:MAG: MacS family sensor histidine kinase [Marmoricola sp.]
MSSPGAADPAGTAVVDTLFRALSVLRVVVLVNAALLFLHRMDGYPHGTLGLWIVIGLAAWTAFTVWAYSSAARRVTPLLLADLAVACAAILATPAVKGEHFNATLPGFWVTGAVLAWAVCWRLPGGLVGSALVSVADLSVRDEIGLSRWPNIFLLLLGGAIVGFLSGLLQRTAVERDRAERAAAAAAERQRLGRVVHDGVLQVLALVQKRGAEIGGESAELGRLAGEQEVALRAYVQREVTSPSDGEPYDLGAVLATLATANVSVAVPGGAVPVPAAVGVEIAAVVAECLSNVRHHVGRDAPAWVLLEDLGSELVVSVRDQGPGIDAGRLEQAAAQGRLGVSSSIRGRVAELGGRADLTTSASGTEWEFRVPR